MRRRGWKRTLNFLASRLAPEAFLHALKKRHYRKVVGTFAQEDEPELAVVRRLVEPGDAVVDLGANIGIYTRFLSEWVGPEGRVFSVEPMPATFEYLVGNIHALGLGNVTYFNLAVSDVEGRVTMEVPPYWSGGDNFYMARVKDPAAAAGGASPLRTAEVACRPLDTLLPEECGLVSFVKCDVEGHELHCLRGAGRFLERNDPSWLIEVAGNPDDPASAAAEVFRILLARGYEACVLDGDAPRPRRTGELRVNYFFLKPEKIGLFRERRAGHADMLLQRL